MLKSNIKLAWRAFFIFTIIFSICTAIFPAQVNADTISGIYGWNYRKELTVYGSSAAVQTNYQKLIRVYQANVGADVAENIAQYTTGDNANAIGCYGVNYDGQTFTAETTGTAKKVWLKLIKAAGTPASYTCAIRATAAGAPTGANLCSGNITGAYVTTTAGGDWYEFDMGAGTALTAGTVYAIILYSDASSSENHVAWRYTTVNAYSGGSIYISANSGSTWSAIASADHLFQVLTSTTGATPLRVDCEAHCQTDFDDLRFTRSDGSTLLDYWIENYDTCEADGYADCWVELNSVVQMTGVDESSTFYMYYGNADATAYSNGSNTFVQFDDFDSYVLGSQIHGQGGWTSSRPTQFVVSDTYSVSGSQSAKYTGDGGGTITASRALIAADQSYLIKNSVWKSDGTNAYFSHGNGTYWENLNFNASEGMTGYAGTFEDQEWITIEIYNIIFESSYNTHIIDSLRDSQLTYTTSAVAPSATDIYSPASSNPAGGSDLYVDNFFVANFAVSQPLWGTPGAETELINPWTIQDVKVFTGYKETGDWLVTIRYVNLFPPYYDTYDVKKYFSLQLLDGSDTLLASTPVPVWGNKVGNIYLSANQVSALTYGDDFIIRMYGNFSGNPYTDFALTSANWMGSDLSQLDNWVITSAAVIGDYYDDLLTTYIAGRGEVLNATGGAIFSAGINGLSTVRPELYQIYTTPINYSPSTTGQAQRISMSNWQLAWGEDGVVMITRISNWLGVDGGLIGGMFFVIMMLVLALVAFPAGHTTAANVLSIPCLGLAVWFGLDLVWLIMLALFAAFLLFKNQFMDK